MDDVRLVCSPSAEEGLWPTLKSLFTFGEWTHPDPKDFVKFCGRFEKQLEDSTVVIQMDEYGTKNRPSGQTLAPLTPNERSWIGAIIGQVSWLARQVRGDLLFGCSRIQQLAGIGDASWFIALEPRGIKCSGTLDAMWRRCWCLGCRTHPSVECPGGGRKAVLSSSLPTLPFLMVMLESTSSPSTRRC